FHRKASLLFDWYRSHEALGAACGGRDASSVPYRRRPAYYAAASRIRHFRPTRGPERWADGSRASPGARADHRYLGIVSRRVRGTKDNFTYSGLLASVAGKSWARSLRRPHVVSRSAVVGPGLS